VEIPPGLDWLRAREDGRAWLDGLPPLLERARERWSLQLGEPFEGAFVSLALPARRAGGDAAVLKLQFPHPEAEHEAAALARWDGDGAVRLLAHAPEDHALLLERCVPGLPLATLGAAGALDVLIGLLPRLWKPATAPFVPLADEAARWAAALPERWEAAGRPFERALVDAAVETLHSLAGSQGESVLLHQDLHGHNVLSAEREPWLAIDPKPLAGERAFGAAPIVRSWELGHGRAAVLQRLDRLSAELGLERERARGWAFAQTLAWAFEGERVLPRHVETARWLAGAQ
jgi:streptomycin 6-kinase